MRELMRQGKNLRRLSVTTIDENERSNRMTYCKTAKLPDVERAVSVTANDTASHHPNANIFSAKHQITKISFPVGGNSRFPSSFKRAPHINGNFSRIGFKVEATYKWKFVVPLLLEYINKPIVLEHNITEKITRIEI